MKRTSIAIRASRMGASAVIAAALVLVTISPATAGSLPTISSFDPGSGPVGTSVAIHGTNFAGTTSVTFNGTNAPGFTVNATGQRVTVNVPTGATTGPIAVTTPLGTAQSSGSFSVTGTGTAPTISSFDPASGNVGVSVTIHGTNFTGVNSVKFNGTPAAFTFVSSSKVKAVVPNGATTGKITLTTPSGTATSGTNFTVTGTAPVISSFNPVSGNVGTTVTIHGSNFGGVNSVKFNGTAAVFTFVNSGKVTAVVPSGATTGKITLTTPSGTATSAGVFTVSGPKITGFNPGSGNVGTTVKINGTNFTGVNSVKFNGTPATFTFVNGGQVIAVVPNGATTGPITLTTPAGTATSAGTFTVIAEHSRTISLSLGRGRLRATGYVGVNDGYGACQRFVPVVIKRFHAGRWHWIARTSTGRQGNFRASIPNRPGRYRARAIKIQLVNGATCKGHLSNVVRHHR
jgi:large repetitive protein